ncbi:hypothetical protein [uncultured Roseibium sp.]|uniref:capsular polysaccharide export protein, LipB/KpsS family n=1 Tax=uncultured Roseibium sp. TaxID=1936171 RepID=UPI00259860ED|nr:hypothetical protein [uncultured Roseibium sp.]
MKKHIVCCGLPVKGGVQLFDRLKISFGEQVKAPDGYGSAINTRSNKHVLTCCPQDIFIIDKIIDHCRREEKAPKIVVFVCDPRLALVEWIDALPHQPAFRYDYGAETLEGGLVSYTDPGVIPYLQAAAAARARADLDILVVRYEDYLEDPIREMIRIETFTTLKLSPEFLEAADPAKHEKPENVCRSDAAPVFSPVMRLLRSCCVSTVNKFSSAIKELRKSKPRWSPTEARILCHAFLIAPKLSKYMHIFEYEKSEDWLVEVRAIAPRSALQAKGTIVAFYTKDTLYKNEAKRLEKSAKSLDLPIELIEVSDQGSWLANVRIKPNILKEARKKLSGPLLYVDVDAVFHSNPWPVINSYDQDVAYTIMRDGKARSGTLLLNDTLGTLKFLDEWQGCLDRDPEAWDQFPLTELFQKNRKESSPEYTIALFTIPLCYVFDRDPQLLANPSPQPIVEHLQASREQSDKANAAGGQMRLGRRRSRLMEIEAGLIKVDGKAPPKSGVSTPQPVQDPAAVGQKVLENSRRKFKEMEGIRTEIRRWTHPLNKKKILVVRPRLDCSFKKGSVPEVETQPTQPIRILYDRFLDTLEATHAGNGYDVTSWRRPLWQFGLEEMQAAARDYDALLFPHKLRKNFDIGKNALFYKATPFGEFFTVDPKGWGASLSFLPVTPEPHQDAPAFFQKLRKRVAENHSIMTQPNQDVELPCSNYLLFICQIPHDETLLYHSDVSVAEALAAVIDYADWRGRKLLVKGHPQNPRVMAEFKQMVEASANATWIEDISIHTCLAGASCVFMVNSGVGFEAMLHKKQVISFGHAEYSNVVCQAGPSRESILPFEDQEPESEVYMNFFYSFFANTIEIDSDNSYCNITNKYM